MTAYQHPSLRALDEFEDFLEAYAVRRLSPSLPGLARIRQAVLSEAASLAAVRALEDGVGNAALVSRERPWWLPDMPWLQELRTRASRPVFAAGLTGLLAATAATAVLGAPPGSPFYNARVALEDAGLPAQLDARLAGHEEHLLTRLAEAEAAAARGDSTALAAALNAYDAEVALAIADVDGNAELLAHLEAMLAKHVAVLTALEAQVPEQASIDNALANSQNAIEKIRDTTGSDKASSPDDQASSPDDKASSPDRKPSSPGGAPPTEPPPPEPDDQPVREPGGQPVGEPGGQSGGRPPKT